MLGRNNCPARNAARNAQVIPRYKTASNATTMNTGRMSNSLDICLRG